MMAPQARNRWMVLGSLLVLSVGASLWLDTGDSDGASVAAVAQPGKGPGARQSGSTEALALEALRRQPSAEKPEDAFAAKSWYVPPPPPKRGPPPAPTAPPLPFAYLGRMVEDGRTTVFLTRQDRNYAAKVGDTLDGSYRVDGIDAGSVTLTYLPLNMQQTLAIGSSR
jgi:hypothetical protein